MHGAKYTLILAISQVFGVVSVLVTVIQLVKVFLFGSPKCFFQTRAEFCSKLLHLRKRRDESFQSAEGKTLFLDSVLTHNNFGF
jgi:hypothetical protein